MTRLLRLSIPAMLVLSACADAGPSEPDGPFLGLQAELYLNAALDIMETNSVRKYEIDWADFRAQARSEAEMAVAVDPADTYPVIEAALERIGDNHSFFQAPGAQLSQAPNAGPGSPPAAVDPVTDFVAAGVGYIEVPAFSGGTEEGNTLARLYHDLIESVDTLAATCRWVVDLRGNTGGNMWPMVAGVGPILGEDTIGFFVDPDSVISTWTYLGGQAQLDGFVIAEADTAYALESPDPWVAVLTDSLTASSGEAVAVAFRGRQGARSFGAPTWGVSTANAAFRLNDGAVIFLTVSTMADRLGTIYGSELQPDELVAGEKTGDPATDAALEAAIVWLNGQVCS